MTRNRPGIIAKLLLAALLFVVAACTSAEDRVLPSCPKATILEGTSTLTRFRDGTGRDPIDVDFTGTITHLNGSCLYDVEDGAGTLNMDVQVEVKVERGPSNRDRVAKFDYFVSVLNSNGDILMKEVFPFSITFFGNKTLSIAVDAPVSMNIPITEKQGSEDFRIFVGFQLSPEEIRYNRDMAKGEGS